MSYDIYQKARFRGLDIEIKMPKQGECISLDFDGSYLVGAINDNGKMEVTGEAINGYGYQIYVNKEEVKFTRIQKDEF